MPPFTVSSKLPPFIVSAMTVGCEASRPVSQLRGSGLFSAPPAAAALSTAFSAALTIRDFGPLTLYLPTLKLPLACSLSAAITSAAFG